MSRIYFSTPPSDTFREGTGLGATGTQPPAASVTLLDPSGPLRAAFAPGVGDLHAGHGALGLYEFDDAREKFNMRVLPDSEILGADASFGRNRGRLGEYQARASHGPAPEVNQVPVVGETVLARVLSHRGNDDAALQGDTTNRKRVKKLRHILLVSRVYLRFQLESGASNGPAPRFFPAP
jgi:hypothetical protein